MSSIELRATLREDVTATLSAAGDGNNSYELVLIDGWGTGVRLLNMRREQLMPIVDELLKAFPLHT